MCNTAQRATEFLTMYCIAKGVITFYAIPKRVASSICTIYGAQLHLGQP